MIVCADADLERAAQGALLGSCMNTGHYCCGTERIYVVEPIYDRFVEKVVVAAKIEALGKLLAANTQLEIQLNGFADPRGTPERNLELSLARADAVREALIRGGVAPEQIRLAAHGEDLTTAAENDVEAYAWERRVSLAIRPVTTASQTAVAQSRE